MEYMESKMQEYMEAGEHRANEIFKNMTRFEEFCLSFPDFDETLLKEKDGYFDYVNEDVKSMWCFFRQGAGV